MVNKVLLAFLLLFFFCSVAYTQEPYLYDSHGRRDPFVPLIGDTAMALESLEDIMSIEDVSLQGIARDSRGTKVVIINGEMIKEGETVGRLTIKKIHKNEVVLSIDEAEYRLSIYEEGEG